LPLLAPPDLRGDESPTKDKQGDSSISSRSSRNKGQKKEGEVGDDSKNDMKASSTSAGADKTSFQKHDSHAHDSKYSQLADTEEEDAKNEKGQASGSLQPSAAASDTAGTEVAYVEMDIPWTIIAVVVGVWVVYAVLYVLMMDVTICTWEYYSLLVSLYPVLIAELLWGFYYLNDLQAQDPGSVLEGDIVWAETSFLPPILAFIIGILSALLGIGGGELMGPLLLSMKVLPQVSAGTTSFMSLLNTSSSIIHYMTLGDVPYTYAAWVFGIGAAGGITGRLLALFVVEKTGRVSILIFMLFVVLVLSFGMFIYDVWVDSVDFSVGSLCDSR